MTKIYEEYIMQVKSPSSLRQALQQDFSFDALLKKMGTSSMGGVSQGVAKVMNLVDHAKSIYSLTMSLQVLLLCVVGIIVCVAVLALLYVLVRVIRPRAFLLWRSENLEKFMGTIHNDINGFYNTYMAMKMNKSAFVAGGANLYGNIDLPKLDAYFSSKTREDLVQDVDRFYKYHDIINNTFDYTIYKSALINEFVQFDKDGKPGHKVIEETISNINAIRAEVKKTVEKDLPKLEEAIYLALVDKEAYQKGILDAQPAPHDSASGSKALAYLLGKKKEKVSYESYVQGLSSLANFVIQLKIFKMYFDDYFEEIKEMHNIRRWGFFNFLLYLVIPYYKRLIHQNVIKRWKDALSTNNTKRVYKEFEASWNEIGAKLADIPKQLADSAYEDFSEKDGTHPEPKTRTYEKGDGDSGDVLEGFGFLKGLLSIGDFFMAILKVGVALANLVTNPVKMVTYLFKLIIGIGIGIVLIILYTLLTIPPFIYIIFGIYFFVFQIVINVIYTVFYSVLFVGFGLQSLVLWVANHFTMGLLQRTIRCEDLPNVWHTRANYIYDNLSARVWVCQYPCSTRFRPAMEGMACKRNDKREPSYCPQAQIYNIYQGKDVSKPWIMDDYKPDLAFWSKSPKLRQYEVSRYWRQRQTFLNKCANAHASKETLLKSICANYKHLPLKNEEDRVKLQALCRQAFCDSEPKEGFCYKFNTIGKEKSQELENEYDPENIVKRILKLLVLMVITIIVALMLVYSY